MLFVVSANISATDMEPERTQESPPQTTGDESTGDESTDVKPPFSDRIEQFLAVYMKDSMLWPVLIAMIAHTWVALSAVMLMVLRDQNPFAFLPMFVVVFATVGALRRSVARKYRAIPILVLSSWLIAGGLALIANHYDVY